MADSTLTDLDAFLEQKSKLDYADAEQLRTIEAEVRGFLKNIVVPAFEDLRPTLENHGRRVQVFGNHHQDAVSIVTLFKEKKEMDYCIKVEISSLSAQPYVLVKLRENRATERRSIRLSLETQDSIYNISKEHIMENFLEQYKRLASPA